MGNNRWFLNRQKYGVLADWALLEGVSKGVFPPCD